MTSDRSETSEAGTTADPAYCLEELPGKSVGCMWGFPTCCLAGFLSRETRLQSFKMPREMEFVR